MPKVAKLTEEQALLITGKAYDEWGSTSNPLKDADDNIVISQLEIDTYKGSDFKFLKSLPLIDYKAAAPIYSLFNLE